ncbi:glycosyltransferase family A protein [Lyngbya sp. PCC 8106]|uniref:glycosyltransferase family 2 protein n=1 Tax=Lyngbya sp. (strain PCC 8106) TaxID=313612 RepID=UPI0000EAD14F|nr:glycosyltransferase family A protein [Lyngbya sp. PCC 8106]EAW38329.1 hypothetical protein L8106_09906 [Lyngbya sp. PCC 8106]
MKISIGILAYNESEFIVKMLHSLLQQSLFQEPNPEWIIEIIVVPNGCTDNTAEIAKKTLETSIGVLNNPNIDWQVSEIQQPGKSNAWNVYTHSLSATDAQYLFLMDSDIELLDPKTLESMIAVLEARPEVWVAVDKPIKDVMLKEQKSLMETLSANVAGLSGNKAVEGGAAWICGQLYCGRAEVLRQIWLPISIQMDDSFIYDMITTEGLTASMKPERVILSPSASHVFESYIGVRKILRHEKWLIIGATINKLLYHDLVPHVSNFQETGLLIKQRNEQNPLWLNELVEKVTQEKSSWLIPQNILTRRFQSLSNKSIFKSVLFFPLATLAFFVDISLSIQANFELQKGKAIGYWGKSTD